jgi:tellurite resistance protein
MLWFISVRLISLLNCSAVVTSDSGCESKERGKIIRVVGRKPSVMVSRKKKIRLHIENKIHCSEGAEN